MARSFLMLGTKYSKVSPYNNLTTLKGPIKKFFKENTKWNVPLQLLKEP